MNYTKLVKPRPHSHIYERIDFHNRLVHVFSEKVDFVGHRRVGKFNFGFFVYSFLLGSKVCAIENVVCGYGSVHFTDSYRNLFRFNVDRRNRSPTLKLTYENRIARRKSGYIRLFAVNDIVARLVFFYIVFKISDFPCESTGFENLFFLDCRGFIPYTLDFVEKLFCFLLCARNDKLGFDFGVIK